MKSTYQFYFGAILLSISQAVRFQGESLISANPTCQDSGERVANTAKTYCSLFRTLGTATDEYDICLEECDPEGYGTCESRCNARLELPNDDLKKVAHCESFAY